MLFQEYLQHYLLGYAWSWAPVAVIIAAYPVRLHQERTEFPSALILISWILMFLFCSIELINSFDTVSSEFKFWFEFNTLDYYSTILIPSVCKQALLTLPFLLSEKLSLPVRRMKLLVCSIGILGIDMALLSTFPQHLYLWTNMGQTLQ